jgi:hypothetical protein
MHRCNRFALPLTLAMLLGFMASPAAADDLKSQLDAIRAVGPLGAGHQAAIDACGKISQRKIGDLVTILSACDGANRLATNWICGAAETIVAQQLKSGGQLPLAELEKFAADTKHAPNARRLAYEWLAAADATAADRLIPGMLNDPALEFRRDAVARLLTQAEKDFAAQNRDAALTVYRAALAAARDVDQIKTITGRLKELGQPVEIATHFGFLMNWKAIGPFDNTAKSGFAVAYPPEREIDLTATYPGKAGEVKWIDVETSDDYGLVDLNKGIGKHMGAVAYVAAQFVSPTARTVDIRFGSTNANKLWLNGKLLSENDAYHAGDGVDQYLAKGQLHAGQNTILLKVCQNEQTESWAQDWTFQLRVCDALGTAILSADRAAVRKAPTSDQAAVER